MPNLQASNEKDWLRHYHPAENDKEYNRTLCHCAADDTWITVETPRLESDQQ